MIEGIVNESVEKTAREWLGPNPSSGKKTRIEAVCGMFSLDRKQCSDLRYERFHRCASAFLEANRFCAAGAVMRVHSFSRENREFKDFETFADAIGAEWGDGDTGPPTCRPDHSTLAG